jgi:hypothetical protein
VREVRIIAQNPDIDISVEMGDGPAMIVSGLGGWQTVDRIDDISITDWVGQAPLQQDVPLLLDGYAKERSVERELNSIFKLGRDAVGEENVPPVFKVFGPVYFEGKSWVLPEGGIELDPSSVIREDDGTLLRQALTLHLLEYVKPDEVKLRKKKRQQHVANHIPLTYITRKGDTLISIAADVLHDWKRWKEIGQKNNLSDPNRKLPPGKTLNLP